MTTGFRFAKMPKRGDTDMYPHRYIPGDVQRSKVYQASLCGREDSWAQDSVQIPPHMPVEHPAACRTTVATYAGELAGVFGVYYVSMNKPAVM